MEGEIGAMLQPYVAEILDALAAQQGQLLIAGPDPELLAAVQRMVAAATPYHAVQVTTQRATSCDRRLFFVSLDPRPSLQYQSLLYYYLELPQKHSCFVCLVSTSSLCLNTLEKRVRSRFRNRIFFIPYLPVCSTIGGHGHVGNRKDGAKEGGAPSNTVLLGVASLEHSMYPTVRACERKMFMDRYGLEPFSLSFFFDLLEPVHIALIAIAHRRRLRDRDAVEAYRNATVHISEIKGAKSSAVLFCYHDLVDAGVIGAAGDLLIDFAELQGFVQESCPAYVKKMIERLKK